MTFSATLDKTLRVYRGSFGRLLAIAAAVGVVQMPLMLMLETRSEGNASTVGFWVAMAGVFVATGIITTIEYAAFGQVLIGLYHGQRVSFRQAFVKLQRPQRRGPRLRHELGLRAHRVAAH